MKCSVCENTDTKQVTVIYSQSPFGQDSDTVDLCQFHIDEARSRYEVVTEDCDGVHKTIKELTDCKDCDQFFQEHFNEK